MASKQSRSHLPQVPKHYLQFDYVLHLSFSTLDRQPVVANFHHTNYEIDCSASPTGFYDGGVIRDSPAIFSTHWMEIRRTLLLLLIYDYVPEEADDH